MKLRKISLKNWRNFRSLDDTSFSDSVFIIGANASGKSNLLDALRFLRDVALPAAPKPGAGGLQEAVRSRGGLSRLRCLHAQKDTEVRLQVVAGDDSPGSPVWSYTLGFKGEGSGNNRIVISEESILRDGKEVRSPRPDRDDLKDRDLLTTTDLETPRRNHEFRDLAHFFGSITYLHLVPQLLRLSEEIGSRTVLLDAFGRDFLQRIAETNERTRDARLRRINHALAKVVPLFEKLEFERDKTTGAPHLKANFVHWRDRGAWQREDQFSDGTFRLIGLLWSLLEGDSLLLLEEPELSLNEEVVRKLPSLIRTVMSSGKGPPRQVVLTTHSEALLSDPSIGAESVVRLQPTLSGTVQLPPTEMEMVMLKSGFPVGAALLPAVRPEHAEEMLFEFAKAR